MRSIGSVIRDSCFILFVIVLISSQRKFQFIQFSVFLQNLQVSYFDYLFRNRTRNARLCKMNSRKTAKVQTALGFSSEVTLNLRIGSIEIDLTKSAGENAVLVRTQRPDFQNRSCEN